MPPVFTLLILQQYNTVQLMERAQRQGKLAAQPEVPTVFYLFNVTFISREHIICILVIVLQSDKILKCNQICRTSEKKTFYKHFLVWSSQTKSSFSVLKIILQHWIVVLDSNEEQQWGRCYQSQNTTCFSADYIYSLNTHTLFFKVTIFREQNYGSQPAQVTKECIICSQFFFSASKLQPYYHLQFICQVPNRGLTSHQAGAAQLTLFSSLQHNTLSCLQRPRESRFQCQKKS